MSNSSAAEEELDQVSREKSSSTPPPAVPTSVGECLHCLSPTRYNILQMKLEEATREYEEAVASCRKEKKKLENELHDTGRCLSEKQNELEKLERHLKDLNEDVSSKVRSRIEATKRLREKEAKEKEQDKRNGNLIDSNEDAEKRLDLILRKIEQKEQECAKLESKNQALKESNRDIKESNRSLHESSRVLQDTLRRLDVDIRERETSIATLRQTSQTLMNNARNAIQEQSSIFHECLQTTNQRQNHTLEQLRDSLATLASEQKVAMTFQMDKIRHHMHSGTTCIQKSLDELVQRISQRYEGQLTETVDRELRALETRYATRFESVIERNVEVEKQTVDARERLAEARAANSLLREQTRDFAENYSIMFPNRFRQVNANNRSF
eukprot:Nk52_evm4s283 gene=Nk52_evmTU4s283